VGVPGSQDLLTVVISMLYDSVLHQSS
jgi:hypothetical protein